MGGVTQRPGADGSERDELDLPPLRVPEGYRRDRRGRWRYARGGLLVPGARDVTLSSLYGGSPRAGTHKAIPAELVRTAPELAWCIDVGEMEVRVRAVQRKSLKAERLVLVPRPEWERREHVPLGLVAPELMPDRLLDAEAVARLAGVDRRTVAAYRSRGLLPGPIGRVGNSPVWSLPIVLGWLADRPGQGVGGGRAAARRPRRSTPVQPAPRRKSSEDLLRWADRVLADYGPDDE